MKTAEEIIREEQVEYNKSIGKSENDMTDEEWNEMLLDPVFQSVFKAIRRYTMQECEKVSQQCADNAFKIYKDNGMTNLADRAKQSILSTPIELT